VTPGGCRRGRFRGGGQALEPDLVADGGVLVVVAVPRPDGAGLVDDPQPAVPEARLPEHRQVRRPVLLDEPGSKAFPVASVADRDVHRAPAVSLVVIDPRLINKRVFFFLV
jgi:hypothetical protein